MEKCYFPSKKAKRKYGQDIEKIFLHFCVNTIRIEMQCNFLFIPTNFTLCNFDRTFR